MRVIKGYARHGLLPSAFKNVHFELEDGEQAPVDPRAPKPGDTPAQAFDRKLNVVDWIREIAEGMPPVYAMSEVIRTRDKSKWLEKIAPIDKSATEIVRELLEEQRREDPPAADGNRGFLAAIVKGAFVAAAHTMNRRY